MAKCTTCKADVIHVRDYFTGATFPVDAEPTKVLGFLLTPPGEGERIKRAALQDVELFVPHNLTCEQMEMEDPPAD